MTTVHEQGDASDRPGDGFGLFDEEFTRDPHGMFDAIRSAACPAAHSDALGGAWMPVTFEDVRMVARSPDRFSSRTSEITGPTVPASGGGLLIPPITSDPPMHKPHRDVLMPYFTPAPVKAQEAFVRDDARRLATGLAMRGEGELVREFAQEVTVATLARLLAVPFELRETFIDWTVRMFRVGPLDHQHRAETVREILDFFEGLLAERRARPGDDLLSHIATVQSEGLTHKDRLGTAFVIVLAGADTTWSAIAASLWHLGHRVDDRDRLVAEPDLMDTAVEELLRYYAPVTVVRTATGPTELCRRQVAGGDRVIAPFGAANRDPEVFPDPHAVRLDRRRNKHLAFGTGAHRCIGASLARMEMKVALQEWLAVMPRFEVLQPDDVTWTGGAVRGPESVPFRAGPV